MTKAFVERESFKHRYAKILLNDWLLQSFDDYKCDTTEVEYCIRSKAGQSKPTKVADIATFSNGSLHAIFEIYHTHRIEKKKLDSLTTKYPSLLIYEVCADSILNLSEKPKTILDLCELMNGVVKKRKSRKAYRSYIYSVEYDVSDDPRYATL